MFLDDWDFCDNCNRKIVFEDFGATVKAGDKIELYCNSFECVEIAISILEKMKRRKDH